MNLTLLPGPGVRLLATWSALLLLAPLPAFADGAITGVLRHGAFGTPLRGATVRITPGNREAVADRAGTFLLPQVPAGTYTLEATYLGLDPQVVTVRVVDGQTARADVQLGGDTIVMQAVTVESIREGQSRAINQQRSASTISNIISSDAIGNLPDRTVGEALARLPGVNVVDDSFANIRGTPAEHNSVTLDGSRFTTAGSAVEETSVQYDNRAVDLSSIPAEMVGGIEVIKALTPDMDADSFGGTINLVSRSAFDLKERSVNGKAEYIQNRFRRQPGRAGSITYLDVFGRDRTVGVAATLTYRDEDRMSNDYEFSYYDAGAIPVGTAAAAGPIAAVGEQALEGYDTRLKFASIEKLGATVNVDWKASETTELHLRTFYEESENQGGRYRNRVRALSRWDAASTAALQRGAQVRLQNYFEDGVREQDSRRIGVDGRTRFAGGGTLQYGVRYGISSESAHRQRYIFDFPSNTERRAYTWSVDRRDPQLPVVSLTHVATGQNGFLGPLADRKLSAVRFLDGTADEDETTANLDYAFTQAVAGRTVEWKTGAKLRSKDRKSRPHIDDFSPPASAVPTMANFTVTSEPRDLFRSSLPTMGSYVSLAEVVNYYRSNRVAFTSVGSSDTRNLDARTYDVNEDVFSAYAMGTTKFGRLEVIGGVRWEQTETGYHWLSDPLGASKGTQRYDDLYPALLLNYRFRSNLVARLAWTHTLSRPAYGDLIPYRAVDDTQGESGNGGLEPGDYPETNKVFLGNAKLKAQRSQNFDLSVEYYLPRSGVVSAAVFRKELRDVIFRSQWKNPGEPNTIYFQERNGSSGKATGLELSWQQALSFLPRPLDGFGVNVNATFIRGSSVLDELVPGSTSTYRPLPVDFLPEQPKKVYNAQVYWERFGITARVAVNYIGEFVRTSGGLTSFSVNDEATRVDASLSYQISRQFTVYTEGRNLTNEVTSWYATTRTRPEDYLYTGAIYTAGIRFRF